MDNHLENNKKTLLNTGCGFHDPERLPHLFQDGSWQEIRTDIDPKVNPDVVTSSSDLSHFNQNSIDAIYSSHNLEHLYAHDAKLALIEFVRILNPQGFALITLPDLQRVAELIVADKIDSTAYVSKMGPITPLDMLFGHRVSVQQGNEYMAHNTGFTASSLGQLMLSAGFSEVRVKRGKNFDLWAVGIIEKDTFGFFNWFDQQGIIV